jgi:hypothetical protein
MLNSKILKISFRLVIFFFFISMNCFGQPIRIEVFNNQILEKSYIGNGVQWSAYPSFDISEKSWQRVFERVDFMKLNFIRLMVNANAYCITYPKNGKPEYNFDADKNKSSSQQSYEVLKQLKLLGV